MPSSRRETCNPNSNRTRKKSNEQVAELGIDPEDETVQGFWRKCDVNMDGQMSLVEFIRFLDEIRGSELNYDEMKDVFGIVRAKKKKRRRRKKKAKKKKRKRDGDEEDGALFAVEQKEGREQSLVPNTDLISMQHPVELQQQQQQSATEKLQILESQAQALRNELMRAGQDADLRPMTAIENAFESVFSTDRVANPVSGRFQAIPGGRTKGRKAAPRIEVEQNNFREIHASVNGSLKHHASKSVRAFGHGEGSQRVVQMRRPQPKALQPLPRRKRKKRRKGRNSPPPTKIVVDLPSFGATAPAALQGESPRRTRRGVPYQCSSSLLKQLSDSPTQQALPHRAEV